MDRTKLYNVITVDGVQELDYLDKPLGEFPMNYTPAYFWATEHCVARPDYISSLFYQTPDYWWIICLANNINNVFTDIAVGDLLIIPNVNDIFSFFKRHKSR